MKKNIQNLVRPNILKMSPYSSARSEFKGQADVFLDANENPFNTGYNRYPDPLQKELKQRIFEIKGIAPKHIFLGNGSDEAIDLLFRIFCTAGQDHIITLPPTYGMYQVSAAISDIPIKSVPLTADFQPDVAAILEQTDEASKLLFLCSPNNPTGNSFDLNLIEKLIQSFPGIVVVDEAYIDFAGQVSCLSLLEQYDNLVVLQTFSKAWGLAGIRLGMAFASEEIIGLFNKVKPPYNVNQLTQSTALKALEDVTEQTRWVTAILEQRAILRAALEGFSFVEKVYPSDANFLLVKVTDPNLLYQHLVEQKIIVRNRSTVLLCEGCLRITVGLEVENQRLLRSLSILLE